MKFTLGKKLGLGFGVVLILMMVSAVLSYVESTEIRAIEHFILSNGVPSIQAVAQLKDDVDYSGSKSRQGILAGTQPARKEDAQKRFDGAWSRIDKAIAKLDDLSARWILQANKDRLRQIKEELPKVREAQQATINTASSGVRDAVIKGGDDYADKVTPVLDGVTKALGDLSDSLGKTLDEQQEKLDSANSSLIWTMGTYFRHDCHRRRGTVRDDFGDVAERCRGRQKIRRGFQEHYRSSPGSAEHVVRGHGVTEGGTASCAHVHRTARAGRPIQG
jgi:CHASE3 domain sensor protein